MSKVRVSVVIPAYNAGSFINEAIDSVLAQRERLAADTVELIVVDDGSTDDTLTRLQSYGARITCVSQRNSGNAARPRNKAMGMAHGEFVFFFDADDVMLPGKIEAALRVFDAEPTVGLVFTNFASIDPHGTVLTEKFLSDYPTIRELERGNAAYHVIPGQHAFRRLAAENFIGTSGVAVRRSVLEQVGGFNSAYVCGEDWDMWLRVSKITSLAYIPVVFHHYRRHPNNITASDPTRTISSQIAMLHEHLRTASDPEVVGTLRRMIARNEFSLGYAHYRNGARALAIAALNRAAPAVSKRKLWLAKLKAYVGIQRLSFIKRLLGSQVG